MDCSSGIAGDMFCAALLDMCPNKDEMLCNLNESGLHGIEYSLETVKKYGIKGSHMAVKFNGVEETQGHPDEHEHHHGEYMNHHHSHEASSLHGIMHILEHLNSAMI